MKKFYNLRASCLSMVKNGNLPLGLLPRNSVARIAVDCVCKALNQIKLYIYDCL